MLVTQQSQRLIQFYFCFKKIFFLKRLSKNKGWIGLSLAQSKLEFVTCVNALTKTLFLHVFVMLNFPLTTDISFNVCTRGA